jgi:hypothetical protein
MALLFLGALVAGYLMLPGERERIAMLERDGKTRLALQALERRFNAGDRSQHTLYQMQELYELFGEVDKARGTLEMLAQLRPRDAQVQRRLASLYKQTQNSAAYVKALRSQIGLKYSEPACRELIGLLRLAGDHSGEQAAIQQCRQRGYRRAEDLVRLASLVAAEGDQAQSSALLRSVDDLRRLKGERDKITLFSTLLELDQPREAQRRAVRWLRGTRDEPLGIKLIEILVDQKRHDMALELARDVSAPGDSISLAVAELMLDRGQTLAAKSYLRGWIEKASFSSAEMAGRFVTAAIDAEDFDNAVAGARKFGLDRLAQSDLVSLCEALAVAGKTREFDEVRAVIAPDVIVANPLLAAAVQMRQGARETGRKLLSEVQLDRLDEWRLVLWTRLMEQTGSAAAASAALRQHGVATEPPRPPQTRAQSAASTSKLIRRIKKTKSLRIRPQPGAAASSAVQPAATPAQPPAAVDPQAIFAGNRGG